MSKRTKKWWDGGVRREKRREKTLMVITAEAPVK